MSTSFADLNGEDQSMDRMRQVTTSNLSNVLVYAESMSSPTLGLGLTYQVAAVSADQMLHHASVGFATSIASGLETLGSEYLEVIEDNFWDLVLR
ncbi:hypothetical protein KI429_05960 [Pseudomonas shirazica]|nr:hypothetical protein KI429_05960 [Pseudomonas shirazica]